MNNKWYLASPFFNEKELTCVAQVEQALREKGVDFWSPREHQMAHLEAGSQEWSMATYMNDVKALDFCRGTIMVYHGNYSDSGTSFEAGYTIARGKPLIVVHFGESSNLMVHAPALANLTLSELYAYDFETLPDKEYTGAMF